MLVHFREQLVLRRRLPSISSDESDLASECAHRDVRATCRHEGSLAAADTSWAMESTKAGNSFVDLTNPDYEFNFKGKGTRYAPILLE
jgi:hypothetical protein